MRIFLDMDCVIADFMGGMCRLYRIDPRELYRRWERGRYGFGHSVQPILAKRAQIGRWTEVTPEQVEELFWENVRGKSHFWKELAPFGWSGHLVELCKSLDPDYRYLTTPTDCGHCLVGKHEWLELYFGKGEAKRMIPCADKWLIAKPDRILIDDHNDNIDKWVEAGGKGILFPALHNRRHAESGYAYESVKIELRTLCEGGAT